MAPVTHFDIDDQWNPDNIEVAQRWHDEEKQWHKQKGACEALWIMPCDEEEAVEVNRNYGG